MDRDRSSTPPRRSLGRAAGLRARWIAALALCVPAAGIPCRAAPPEVVRVRVPSRKVADWFPPGEPLRLLAPSEFDALLKAADKATRQRSQSGPRLIRARHSARFSSGLIRGSSELVVADDGASGEPSTLSLEPWSPAILGDAAEPGAAVGASALGETILRLAPAADPSSERTIKLEWELRARPGSRGRDFALALPGDATTILTLDAPRGWEPSGPAGQRLETPPETDADRETWRFLGRVGELDLRFVNLSEKRESENPPHLWVSGPTRVDLRTDGDAAGDSANWTTEWTIQADAPELREFSATLDPGLELLDVNGPNVQTFRLDPDPNARRVTVVLSGSALSPSVARFEARASVPAEGNWSAPAIHPERPVIWTGGTTTILLDDRLVLRDCRERDGRRVPPLADGASATTAELVFEATAPGSVADLTFRPAGPRLTQTARGRVYVGASSTRMACELLGLGKRGSVVEHAIEIPPGWTVDGVEIGGVDEDVSWNQTVGANGGALLRVLVPPSDDAPEGRTLSISASTPTPPGGGHLALPRVRLANAPIAEEVWVALVDDQTRLSPISTSGLAWIDPAEPPGLLPPAPPPGFAPALAWRWTAETAAAVVDRQRVEADRQGWVYVKARVGERERRLVLEGRITVETKPGERSAPPIWIDQPTAALTSWSFVNAETRAGIEPIILDDSARRKTGLPRAGAVLALPTEPSKADRVAVDFRATLPWSGRGRIPLPCLPGSLSPRGVVVIETTRQTRSRIETEGLHGIEPSLADRLAPGPTPRSPAASSSRPSAPDPFWTAHALAYSDPGCRLDLVTEELAPAEVPGLIRRARLTTQVFADGRSLNRLRLLVAGAPLRLRSPAGLELIRIRVDGRDVEPILEGDHVTLPTQDDSPNRNRAIEMDYRVEADPAANFREIRPKTPDLGLPCVSFDWELIPPEGWAVARTSPGLVVSSTPPRGSWPFDALGFPNRPWPGQSASARPPDAGTIQWLDARLQGAGPEGLSFAEWFTRWDSGSRPVVIDRAALSDGGRGPRSRCEPAPRDPEGAAVSIRTLRQYGLVPLIVDDALVITTQREAAALDAATSWRAQVSEALFWGGDKTDRFQSAARWRGEPSWEETAAGVGPGLRQLSGFRSWRLTASSWPDPDAMVTTTNATTRTLLGWLVLATTALLVGANRANPSRADYLVAPLLLMVLAVALRTWAPDFSAEGLAGLLMGALVVLLARLGGLFRAARGASARSGRSSPSRRLLGARFTALGVAAAILAPSSVAGVDEGEGEKPIVALIPHDEPFDPAAPPARVILRDGDYRRLQELARSRGVSTSREPMITEAKHRVVRSASGEITVTSEYALSAGDEPGAFILPVSGARDLQATIDDEAVPIAITPGGESGVVNLPAGRAVLLRFRRVTTPTREGSAEILSLRINPSPRARLTLEQPPGAPPVQQLGGRGGMASKGNQTIEAELGPTNRLEIGWTATDPTADQAAATVESLILWDLDPAGERVRARLTYRPRRRVSTIRIALEPGLSPRSIQIPGLVDTTWGGTPQNPEWIARVDPPLQDRTTIDLEFWRPLQAGSAEADAPSGTRRRRFPRVEPLGMDLGPGLLAARRPGHWTGRLESPPGTEPVGDESFVRAWGTLPDEPLTFAGTVRFNHRDAVEFATGPTPTRWRLKPTARLRVDSGRIDCRIDAELSEITGLLDHVNLELPDDLIVVGVDSEDLTDWSRPPGKPLQVRFDRVDLKSRRDLTIRGWIPVSRPAATSATPRRLRSRLPWIGAAGNGEANGNGAPPGTLIVASRGPIELISAEGGASPLTMGDVAPDGGDESPGWTRQAYRIDDPTKVGELRWTPPPPRVNVRVDSQVTIHPDSAEWVAVLCYDVIGDELDAIHLKVPAAWAARARLQLTGRDYQLTTESRDQSTFWSLTPERPIWGSQRLILRSSLPLTSERQLEFPEITPLGKGIVDSHLGVVFATASPPVIEGSAGLRPIAHASRFQDAVFGDTAGMVTRAFRVERDGWSLKVQGPPGGDAATASGDQSATVETADVSLVMAADGSILGRATYRIQPHSGRFLIVEPTAGSTLAWATVDGSAVAPLLAEGGRWTIPLGEPAGSLVNLEWTEPPRPAGSKDAPRSFAPPRAGESAPPSVLTIYPPVGAKLQPAPAGLEPVGPERLDLERAGWIGWRISELLGEMDRGSGRDRQRLASLLIEHELTLRSAERALRAMARGADRARGDQAARELEMVQASRDSMAEAVGSAGMAEQIEAARVYLGLAQQVEGSEGPGIPEPDNAERIRRIGQPTFLIGVTPGLQAPPARVDVALEDSPRSPEDVDARGRAILVLVFLLSLVVAAPPAARQAVALGLLIVAGLALLAIAGGPAALAAGSAVAFLGWWLRPGDANPKKAAA